ncbi:MAG: hypothetical protein AAGD10_18030 [Myxococcota bacterium]
MSISPIVDVGSALPSIRYPDDSGRALQDVIDSAPEGAVVELAPGRFEGPIVLRRPMTLKGAGDLTRIVGGGRARPVIEIDAGASRLIFVESVAIGGAESDRGAGVRVLNGRVRLYNVHGTSCQAREEGGFLWVGGGEVEASVLRIEACRANRGGAIYVRECEHFVLRDSEIHDCEAVAGGGLFVAGGRPRLSRVRFSRTRATAPGGGQAARQEGGVLHMERVLFEDPPIGQPFVGARDAKAVFSHCDMPSDVMDNEGVHDEGGNRWR